MSKTSIIITIALIIIVGLGLYYFIPDSWRFWDQGASVIDSLDDGANVSPHERITAKHQYKNGTHIIAGETTSPTPCDILTTNVRIAESYPEQVTIEFTSKSDADVCAQVVTRNRFKVDFKAAETASIKATWNGQPVELNLIPAGDDENLLDFELFIKG